MPKTKSMTRGLQNLSIGKLSSSSFKTLLKNIARLNKLNDHVSSCNHAPPNIKYKTYKKRKYSFNNNLLVPT